MAIIHTKKTRGKYEVASEDNACNAYTRL